MGESEKVIRMSENDQNETRKPRGTNMYSHIRDAWKTPNKGYLRDLNRQRRIRWRREINFSRVERPTRLDRARALGYKAKQGFVVIRGRVPKGSFGKRAVRAGRRAKRLGFNKITGGKSQQRIAEERAQKRFTNLEVLNSYWVGADGQYEWYEIIMVDPYHPSIMNDPKINWICTVNHKGRAYRGKTGAGKKGRGQRNKGKGAEKVRPSIRAKGRRGK